MERCPFCSHNEVGFVLEKFSNGVTAHSVMCTKCFAKGPIANDQENAKRLWNERKR